jgi:uncharacterized protein YkwD
MKKIRYMAATVIAAATLAGSAMTTNAACLPNSNINLGKISIIRMGKACDLNSLLSQLNNCLPGIQLPKPEMPDTELPTPEQPDEELPSPEFPELDSSVPEQNLSYEQQVINLVNAERAKEGLAPLTLSTKVAAAARMRAKEIMSSFSHTRPDGSSFATALKEQNVSYRRAGENIAWGQKSPETVVNAWMNSEGHRANIMNANFTSIGVGYYQVNGVSYWCQLFIS